MAMKTCKDCGKEISSSAKKCPNCGVDPRSWFVRHKIMTFIGAIIIISIMGSAFGGDKDKNKPATVGSGAVSNEVIAKVGDVVKTGQYEITVTSITERPQVGKDYFKSNPAEGGTYIAVNWQFKNISDKPITAFALVSMRLMDKNGTKYDADIGASSSYATELNLDRKVLSDLNPGITVKDAQVFEISKEQYKTGGYRLFIHADKDAVININ